jgi:hypothetical protein
VSQNGWNGRPGSRRAGLASTALSDEHAGHEQRAPGEDGHDAIATARIVGPDGRPTGHRRRLERDGWLE